MSIRRKIWLASLFMLLVGTLASTLIFESRLTQRFEHASIALVKSSGAYIRYLLDSDREVLKAKVVSMAEWDQAYDFVRDPATREVFLSDNLDDPALADENYDGMFWFDAEGRAICNRWRADEHNDYAEAPPELLERLANVGLIDTSDPGRGLDGYLDLGGQVFTVVSWPVIPHSYKAEPAGRAVALSRLRPDRIAELAELLGRELRLHVAGGDQDLGEWQRESANGIYLKYIGDGFYQVANLFTGVDGEPAFALSGKVTDELGLMAETSRRFLALSVAACLLLAILMFMLYLEKAFLGPLSRMLGEVQVVRDDASHDKVLSRQGPPELQNLASAINEMVEFMREKERGLVAANDATRAKSDFLASMAHEIRTPMNGVLATADLLMDSDLSDDQREHVETIVNSGGTLLTTINDILDFSKMEAGKLRLEAAEFDLESALDGIVRLLSPAADSKGLELAFDYPPYVPRLVVGDVGRLRQIITNLLGNAVKFTMSGHVLVRVSREFGPKGAIVIAVEDSGIGISESGQARLFNRYEQAEDDTSRKFGGTGLGLMICKQLTEMMGGRIWVESQLGQGSKFFVSLPFSPSGLPAPSLNSEALPLGSRVLVAVSGLAGRILARQLGDSGLKVDYARDVEETLCTLDGNDPEHPYALFIFDRNLAGGGLSNFLTSARLLGQEPFRLAWRSLLIVPIGDRKSQYRARLRGFDAIMGKPASLPKIVDILNQLHAPEAAVEERHQSPVVGRPGLGLEALVVDDNDLNRLLAKRMLEKLGCRVDLASGGEEALEACVRKRYDVVFMDCQMPDLDGYETTRRLRALENGSSSAPVVAMTGFASEDDRRRSLAAGMNGHIVKPFSLVALKKALIEHSAGEVTPQMETPADDGAQLSLENEK